MSFLDMLKVVLDAFKPHPAPTPASIDPPHVAIETPNPLVPPIGEPEWLTICRPMTEHFENCYLIAYCDPASAMGKALQADGLWYRYLADRKYGELAKYANLDPHPWTCGWGDTVGVTKGTTFTQSEADSRLTLRLTEVGAQVDKYVKVQLLPHQQAAIKDWTYNEGIGRLTGSTMLLKLNANDFAGAMTELLKWDIAGGKTNQGLINRRAAEKLLFLTGAWKP